MRVTRTITRTIMGASFGLALTVGATANAAMEYDQDVTPEFFNGTGNDNGHFTTDRNNGVELGLRGKLRYNEAGNAENTFNSNGDGTYTFSAGVAPTQSYPKAEWSFEWSINTDYDEESSSGYLLNDLTYELSMTSTTGASIDAFDPINGTNPNEDVDAVQWDHAIGDNDTDNGEGHSISNDDDNASGYADLIGSHNVAQNSWQTQWYSENFDPTAVGDYDFVLSAFDDGTEVASTNITISAVPEPTSGLLFGLAGLAAMRRRRRRA